MSFTTYALKWTETPLRRVVWAPVANESNTESRCWMTLTWAVTLQAGVTCRQVASLSLCFFPPNFWTCQALLRVCDLLFLTFVWRRLPLCSRSFVLPMVRDISYPPCPPPHHLAVPATAFDCFHTDSWQGHLIQSRLRSCPINISDKHTMMQCLGKVKNSLQWLHGKISKILFLLVLSCSLRPLVLNVVLGIRPASLISLSQRGQAISSRQGVTLDPTLLWREGRMGLAYSVICFSTGKEASKENEIVVGRSDDTTSRDGVKKKEQFSCLYRAAYELITIHTLDFN